MKFATKLIHEGQEPGPATGAVNTLLYGSIPTPEKIRAGINEDSASLSIGIEDEIDLIDDIKQALAN